MRRPRSDRRGLHAFTIVALAALTGCASLPIAAGRASAPRPTGPVRLDARAGHTSARHPTGPVRFDAPADRTQAPRDGTVPVVVQVARPRAVPTLRLSMVTGLGSSPRAVDLTPRLATSGRRATVTLHAADLRPGLTTLRATVDGRRRRDPGRAVATTTFSWEPQVDLSTARRCDFLVATRCLFPFPDDWYTVRDPRTVTGRRVDFARASMPANAAGVHIDPTEWNRNDGFSPGSEIVTYVPNVDLARSGATPVTDIGRSLAPNAPIVIVDARTGRRVPLWAELDANASTPTEQALLVHPARALTEGHRYVVAFRDLRDAAGHLLAAPRGFVLYRDRIPTFSPVVEGRRAHMEALFRELRRAGVRRHDLYLAWDFTVASARSLSGRMLHIRDAAFATLHGHAPSFTVTSVQDDVDARIWRRVTGTFQVPLYLTGTGAPGSRFHYSTAHPGPYTSPTRNGTYTAQFRCDVPRAAVAGGEVHPARASLYGHGLFGSDREVDATAEETLSNGHDLVLCATDWIGMSSADVPNAVSALQDLSRFPTIADRLQQGILDTLFLGRLMIAPGGLASSPAFRAGPADRSVLDTRALFYDGNSMGGIMGGAATAVAQDWTRAVLGVPGMDYSLLLPRSVDFVSFESVFYPSYPDVLTRQLDLAIVQMLWDRGEADGYAQHLTRDPYPATPRHVVLLHEAFGDHQVANVSTEVEARTIGAFVHQPALAPGRSTHVVPFFGIPAIPSSPFRGSALVVWDSGTPAPPTTDTPPSGPQYGHDPHEDPRNTPASQLQISDFLRIGGAVVDTCGGAPCAAVVAP